MQIKDLYQTRQRNIEQLKAIAENPANNGELSQEQEAKFLELRKSNDSLDARIERQQYLDGLDKRSAGITLTGDKRSDDFSNFSVMKAIMSCIPNSGVDAGFEKEVSQELSRRSGRSTAGFFVPHAVFQKRVLSSASGAAGSYLIPTEHGALIDILRAKLISQKLGATVLSDLQGDLSLPRIDASASAQWVADGNAITASNQTLGQVNLAPKHVGSIVEYSRNMLLQSSPSVEEIIRNDLAQLVAEGIDRVVLDGNGTNEPLGIISNSAVPTVAMGTDGAVLTYAKILELLSTIEDANATATGWAMSPKVAAQLRATKRDTSATDSEVVLNPDAVALLGLPYIVTSLIGLRTKGASTNKCSSIIIGNWSDVLIGYWGGLEILSNPYESTAFSKGNVQVRVIQSCDVSLRHGASFAKIIDAKVIA